MQPRVAWFTPLPPIRSGISQYSVELLPLLTPEYRIELFVDAQSERPSPALPVFSAHDFVWKHSLQPYDLVVYQVGNAPCHDYMWAYLVRYPGLVVLHDGQLHHARGRSLLQQKRDDDYRAEFRFNHPDVNTDVAEIGVAGLLGASTYLWPMRRIVVDAARLVVVHNQWLAGQIRQEHPEARVTVVEMGVPAPVLRAGAREIVRQRHGIQADAVLFTAIGRVTPEKRISQVIGALAAVADTVPNAHLLLAGETVDYYDADAEARARGIRDRVTLTGFVPDEEVADYLAAADVCICLRWPTSRETSASWLRCLAGGRPTIMTNLVHTVDIPAIALPPTLSTARGRRQREGEDELDQLGSTDPARDPTLSPARGRGQGEGEDQRTRRASTDPACVSIDLLDEDRSLSIAMRRLATDARLRETLGRNALRLWADRFTLERMAAGYRNALEAARAAPANPSARSRLPRHLLPDGTEHAARLLSQMGLSPERVAEVWHASATTSGL